jgi:hypothetical protein
MAAGFWQHASMDDFTGAAELQVLCSPDMHAHGGTDAPASLQIFRQ